jgi:RHS repeat-associated protein
VFNYDLADQATGVLLNVQTPQSTPTPAPNITYDSNGNRTSFHPPYVSWETYGAANNLNQYTTRTISGTQKTAGYDHKGNLTIGLDSSAYVYDAQNRLTNAPNTTIKYDGLNRQVSRTIGSTTTYSVWDGWNLIEEYQPGNVTTAAYLYGATGLISGVTNGQFTFYFQDASGSTSHVTEADGSLLEWYRYDLQGKPIFYNQSDQQITASAFGVCYLFTGQQWRSELGLYDLRNRFYSPDIGRFLQADPIGFWGDRTNLYRHCGNNPVTRWDPVGLQGSYINDGSSVTVERVTVTDSEIPLPELTYIPDLLQRPTDLGPLERFGSSNPGSGGDGGPGGGGGRRGRGGTTGTGSNSTTQQSSPPQQNPPQPSINPLHATTTAEFIAIGNMIEHGDTTDTTPAIDPIDLLSGGIAALVRSSFRSVLQKAAVFWAGGRAAEDVARTFAKASGGTVIADTAAGRALAQSTANIPWSQARIQWVSLSEEFARSASGEVYVFQNARGVPLDSIWRNEYQILSRNPNVTGINFSVVMPDGSVVPVP